MLGAVGYCWMMLEWFGHSTQQSHVGASAMVKTRHILSSFAWVEGNFGRDLRKVEAESRKSHGSTAVSRRKVS